MFGMGIQEIGLILVIAVVVIGPKHLPQVARTLGKAITQFKRSSNELRTMVQDEMSQLEEAEPVKAFKNTIEAEMGAMESQSREAFDQWNNDNADSPWPDSSIATADAVAQPTKPKSKTNQKSKQSRQQSTQVKETAAVKKDRTAQPKKAMKARSSSISSTSNKLTPQKTSKKSSSKTESTHNKVV